MKFNDPKLKNEIFVRIDMKHSYFSNFLFAINFSAVETVVVYQKLIHIYAYILAVAINNKSNFVYILVHRNYVYLKTILAVTLCSTCASGSCVRRWSLLLDCLPVKFKDPKFMKFS